MTLVQVASADGSKASSKAPSNVPELPIPFLGGLEPMIQMFNTQLQDQGTKSPSILKPILNILTPSTPPPAKTTTTTTRSPIEDLTRTLVGGIPGALPQSGLLQGPATVLNSMISLTNPLGKVLGGSSKSDPEGEASDDRIYYEYDYGEEASGRKRPHYFSHDCNFRVACEIGRTIRPMTTPFHKIVETNKLIQDLQNRFTRAATYGMLHNDCERYYCLFVKILGGPKQFASGVADMVNRLANPEMYQ